MIDHIVIDEIKSRSSIEDIIGQYVTLRRGGSNMIGLCPFHSEKSPSFTVFTEGDQHFYCFGCGAGGDVVSFIMRAENLEYPDALRFLARRAGIEINEEQTSSPGISRSRFYEMNLAAARFFRDSLPSSPAALDYIAKRELSPALVRHFGIGYSPEGFGALTAHMTSLGYGKEELATAFLCGISKKTNRPFDYFRGRLMFPIMDNNRNVIAFGGRVLDDSLPKYLNSSDTPVFKKSRNLFALNFARSECSERLILCEGYMDVIALHGAGFSNSVATLGTALTPDQARIMKKYTKGVIISYDSDAAGQKAADRALKLFEEVGLEAKVLHIEDAKDPDEYIRKFGAESFRKMLDSSKSRIMYKLDVISSKYNIEDTDEKVKAAAEITEAASAVYSEVERDIMLSKAAERFALDRNSLKRDTERLIKRKLRTSKRDEQQRIVRETEGFGDRINPQRILNNRAANAEEIIIGILLCRPELKKNVSAAVTADDFVTDFNRRVFGLITSDNDDDVSYETLLLENGFSLDEVSRVTSMYVKRQNLLNNESVITDCQSVLREVSQRGSLDIEQLLARKRQSASPGDKTSPTDDNKK